METISVLGFVFSVMIIMVAVIVLKKALEDEKYIEWNGEYLYSDQPFEVADPVVRIQGE